MNGPKSKAQWQYGFGDTRGTDRHRHAPRRRRRAPVRRRRVRLTAAVGAAVTAVVIAATLVVHDIGRPAAMDPRRHGLFALPTTPGSYIGLAPAGVPGSYAGVTAFTSATRVKPHVITYYSGWLEPFQTNFANTVAEHGEVLLVQIDPTDVNLSEIAGGKYDGYLYSYAEAVRADRHPVILSFGHEMNAGWYSWGHQHTSPAVFVAAWRHIVNLFRVLGARNVTWLWTVNVINDTNGGSIPRPGPWWPGGSYVTWVGIDGYYLKPSWKFAPLFGPTIAAVRTLTADPILISETAATPAAGQPAKIADLFAGIRLYGLLGFVWFDTNPEWRLSGAAAIAAFRRGAKVQ
jgi:mannan endo-1,4-beta-mannosidase